MAQLEDLLDQRFLGKFASVAFGDSDLESLTKTTDAEAAAVLAKFQNRPGQKLKLRLILREVRGKELESVKVHADNSAAVTVAPFPELDWTELMGGETVSGEHDLHYISTVLVPDVSLTPFSLHDARVSYASALAALEKAKADAVEAAAAEAKRIEEEAAEAKREAEAREAAQKAEDDLAELEAAAAAASAAEAEAAAAAAEAKAKEYEAAMQAAGVPTSASPSAVVHTDTAADAGVPPPFPSHTAQDDADAQAAAGFGGPPPFPGATGGPPPFDGATDPAAAAAAAAAAVAAALVVPAPLGEDDVLPPPPNGAAADDEQPPLPPGAATAPVKNGTTPHADGEEDGPPPLPPGASSDSNPATKTPTESPATAKRTVVAGAAPTTAKSALPLPPAPATKAGDTASTKRGSVTASNAPLPSKPPVPTPAATTTTAPAVGGALPEAPKKDEKKKAELPKKLPMTQVQFEKFAKRIEKFRIDKKEGKLVDHDAIASMKGVNKALNADKKDADKKDSKENKKVELSPQELAKKAAEEEAKRKRDEEEREKALNLLRGAGVRRGGGEEFVKQKLAKNQVEMDAAIENDKTEESDDLMTLPLVSSLLQDYERKGILAKRDDGFFSKTFKPMVCILKDGYLFWMKAESEKLPLGMVKVIKPSIKLEITDSVLEITDKNVTHRFKSLDDTEDPDEWKKSFRQSKVNKFHKKKASSIFAGVNMGDLSADGKTRSGSVMGGGAGGSAMGSTANATKELELKRKAATQLVCAGAMFQKFKHGSSKARMIWIPNTVDRILWGEKDKKKVKGFIMTAEVTAFASGCSGSKKPDLSFTVLTKDRNLELEAENKEQRDKWMDALKILCNK